MVELTEWANFYVIVGSSAGALTGLQFVVMALIADMPHDVAEPQTGDTFATPTIVHFGAVLLMSAILAAPWHVITPVAVLWGLMGIIGVIYAFIVARRMRRQTRYQPVFEDWLFNFFLPVAAYALVTISAFATRFYVREALFGVATAALLLLFIGIHNAWDATTYLVLIKKRRQ